MVRQPLSSLALSLLSLEAAATPMHLGAVLVFGPGGGSGGGARGFAERLRARTAAVPGLRLRLEAPGLRVRPAAWVNDAVFDAALHVRSSRLGRGDRAALADRVAELMAVPLARDRPPWELHVLGGLAQDRIAVLVKMHAALACDLDAVDLGLRVFDEVRAGSQDHAVVSILPRLGSADRDTAGGTMAGLSAGLSWVARVVDPRTVAAGLAGRVHDAGETARIAAAVAQRLVRPTPGSLLDVAVGPTRQVGLRCVDLDDIHRVRKLHGGTVHDVVLAMVAGGLRSWMAAEGRPRERPLRVLIPVARQSRAPDRGMGTTLGGYLLDLPIGEPDPVARLHAVRQAMSANKLAGPHRGPGAFPVLAEALPAWVPWFAAPVAGRLAAPAARLFNAVVTTWPLSGLVLGVAGIPLEEVYPLVPLGERHALAVAVAAYRDKLHIGLHVDPEAIPRLDQLGDAVAAALTELAHTAAS